MKKKFLFALMLVCLAVLLCSCAQVNAKSDRLNVVTTIFPPYDFARQIAGDKIDLTMLISPGSESHTYEPTVKDLIALKNADVFVYIGGESDEWFEDLIAASGNSELAVIKMLDCVDPLFEEDEDEYDEHVWTTPENCKKIALEMCGAFCEKDGENADFYKSNYALFAEALTALDADFKNAVSAAKKPVLVFSERFPFRYFAAEYGVECHSAFSGCAVNDDAPLSVIAELISVVKNNGLSTVLYTEFSSEEIADTICLATGAKKALFHSCHNVSEEDFNAGVTYIELMRHNLEVFTEAIK